MDWGPIATALAAVLASIFAAAGTVYVARSKNRTDLANSMDQKFGALTDQLQEERRELYLIIEKQNEVIDRHRLTIEKFFSEITDLQIERRELFHRIDQLERTLRAGGLQIPPS